MMSVFQIASLSPGLLPPRIALATCRAGGLGILDFEFVNDLAGIQGAIEDFASAAPAPFGIKLSGRMPELLAGLLPNLPSHVNTVVVTSNGASSSLSQYVGLLRDKGITVLVEATSLDEAIAAQTIGADGILAKGHEAGGRVADETAFILLQRFLAKITVPVWVQGGIGWHTAAACAAAGAAGVVLDVQLALTRESALPEAAKTKIAAMDGSETVCLGEPLGELYRIYSRPGSTVVKDLEAIESRLAGDQRSSAEVLKEWRAAIAERAGWDSDSALLIGQDAAFAAPLAERFCTVGGVIQGIRSAIRQHCESAARLLPLAEGSPLAASNGTHYPILQGPMTRVSDVPDFAARVAEGGALPFLALALMRGPEVENLLKEARQKLEGLPWGVGILGFVPAELRQEQMEVVSRYRPPFALIAGGRPEQSRMLEEHGITSYLHVPSPGLLKIFIDQGARRFVFEGRECGGHVGPRTSFVLWSQMVDTLLAAPEMATKAGEFHVVFAAGIHDALSAAMVAVIAAPLAERGVKIGVLIGTAYLFTEEAVGSGAIMGAFQRQAQECRNTVLLTTGPGHSTRCVDTPFAAAFAQEKRRMIAAGRPAEEIRLSLEELNLGRLRIASKGVTRHSEFGRELGAPKLVAVQEADQLEQGMYMIGQVAALRNTTCTIPSLHHEIAAGGSAKLQSMAQRFSEEAATPVGSPSDVAIIGMACLLPKAPGLQAYWENILGKVDAVTEVPKERWDWELYFDSNPKAKDKIYSRWGGFLDDAVFDPVQYGMPPASLKSIEPAQLLTLQVVRAALEDAGYATRPFPRERTSVILGAGGGAADLGLGYSARSFMPALENIPEFRGRSEEIIDRLNGRLPEWTEDSFAGILTNVSAGRVANRFDLGGTNYTVDAACASSLAATALAIKELEARTSDMVIVGGVDTMQNPFTYLCFSKTHALSPRGRCRPFDESADGIAISEGIAIAVLKRLEDAERDGDRIYAVIKAAGSSSDGRDRGLTAPRPEGQVKALKRAYAKANFSPATVELIEAHGTGTVAGDGAEVQALTEVFSEAQAPREGCAVGSVKSMIGHTKCTAGAAGLVKAALALHHKILPPTLGVEKPNPRARFPETPFYVNTEPRPWLATSNDHPRRAGVSAFGFGGTNFHLVLEEYANDRYSARPAPIQQWPDELFLWKAESRETLLNALTAWDQALATAAKPALRDLAYTAWKQAEENGKKGGTQCSLAIVASSLDDLKQKLASARESLSKPDTQSLRQPRGIYFSTQSSASEAKVAWLFPGQGSQYPRMLQDLLLHFPEMRQVFERASAVLNGQLAEPFSSYVFPPASFGREEEKARQTALTQTNIAQPALGAVSMAMLTLLREFGLKADMAAGHSYGEYVALAAAGVLDLETLMALSEARGRFIVEGAVAEPGVMAAVSAEAAVVAEVIQGVEGVCIANSNAPRQTVISGSREGVASAVERFTARDITARMIPVACAFHSPLVAPAQARLAEFLASAPVSPAEITVYSNTTAAPYPAEPAAIRSRLVEHLTQPVQFAAEIEAMYEAGARTFVEVGPRGVLTNLVEEILADRPKLAVASNQSGKAALPQLLHLLGQLAVQGCGIQLDRLYRDRTTRVLDLRTLKDEGREKPPAPSAWLVNGARARPVKETSTGIQRHAASNTIVTPSAISAALPATPPVPAKVAATNMAQTDNPAPAPGPAASAQTAPAAVNSAPPAGSDEVMIRFQQTMARFLETQKSVLLAYLGTAPDTASAPYPTPALETNAFAGNFVPATTSAPVFEATTVEMPRAHETAEPGIVTPDPILAPAVNEPPPQTAGVSKDQLTAQLLSIVSDRTGYPPEMLDLNLDLEADLGIDSIKRVEILGTLQQSFAASGASFEDGLMEKLAGVRTLQGIIDRVVEHAGGGASEAPAGSSAITEPIEVAAASASAGLDRAQLTAQLLAIVSDRTGYPPEMLDLKLDLEADLGIDSIKRVEILGTLQQSFTASGAGLNEGLMEKLAGVRTLEAILDQVSAHIDVASQPKPPAAIPINAHAAPIEISNRVNGHAESAIEDPNEIGRFRVEVVDAPVTGKLKSISKDRVILMAGGHEIAAELAAQWKDAGYRIAQVLHGAAAEELEVAKYSADFGSLQSISDLIALINQRQGPIGGIVHLLSLEAQAGIAADNFANWKHRTQFGVKSLFHLAKAAGEQLRAAEADGGGVLMAVTSMGGTFLTELPAERAAKFPEQGAIAGLIKTLGMEWPEVRVKVVDVDLDRRDGNLTRRLFEEMQMADGLVEVGFDGHRRITLRVNEAPMRATLPPAMALDPSSVILITGGARGITARAAMRLAELYQPTFILVGRSPLPAADESPETAGITTTRELKAALMNQMRARGETVTPALVERAYARLAAEREIRANLAGLRRLGAQVHYYSIDVRDQESYSAFIDSIYNSFGRIDGVIHGAGVIEDKLIQDKAPDSFDRVFDTKADSAFVLRQKLRPEGLKFVVFFSSVSGRFGNRGQGDYAAANEVLNKLAVCLDREWPARVVAINWGPWDTDGMVSAEVRKQFEERGVKLISTSRGLRHFEDELNYGRRGESEVVIGGAGWQLSQAAGVSGAAADVSQPLLAKSILSRSETAVELVREIDRRRDVYLNDHCLDGKPVLPLAIATELIAETVAHGWPELQIAAIRGLRLLHGVIFDDASKTVRIVAKPQGNSDRTRIGVEITSVEQPRRVHYKAIVELAERLPDQPTLHLPTLSDAQPFGMEIPEFYERWLFHGPMFQGIQRVEQVGVGGVKALLQTSSPNHWIRDASGGQWLVDPLMFDSALQLVVLWARQHWDMTALPNGFESYRRFASVASGPVWCDVRIRPTIGKQTIHADMYFFDAATGRVLGILENMEGASSKALNRLADRHALAAVANES